ncbi:lysR substrate binding domain protein (plasmid) [Ochrobactrum quorumnocens]|uniref:LysR substrate binding domain protein n=2 Tax=Ochrobactrum quorumnocens TaxID=271865 RepID=A0A248UQ53_9HYPH|nr:LysR substrate-binding domain-containing protein [[Ochrobactrum] quorumnocens]ASV88680.1 lysR substrate binding domain protein [[Ochrobactrum] quorumnocens]
MELRHLRYFITVAEELHFSRASERLNIAAPTLTVQIQEIERVLSVRLFTRTKRSVTLTSAGKVFLDEARLVLDQYAKAESAGRRAGRGEIGRIEIGYVGSSAYAGVLQEQISRFTGRWPGVDIRARECPMEELPKLIEEGQLDLGFVRLPMIYPSSLRSHILLRDVFCLAVCSGHPEAKQGAPLSPHELAGLKFVMPEQELGTYEVARRGRFPLDVIAKPGSLLSVLTQVSLGTGVSVIPSSVRNAVRLPNIEFRSIAGKPITSEIAVLFRAEESAPSARNFIQQIVQTPISMLGVEGQPQMNSDPTRI